MTDAPSSAGHRLGRLCGLAIPLRSRGQTLAEFAMVMPLIALVVFGIISLGLWVFYQQQVANVAREAARHAAIHSSTAPCPTVGWRDPQAPPASYPFYPLHCDGPNNPNDSYPWPRMTDFARRSVWGVNPASVKVNACWSGYAPAGTTVPYDYGNHAIPNADYPADQGGTANVFVQCHLDGLDPTTNAGSLGCRDRMTTIADDPSSPQPGNQVTVYACLVWAPPLAGFLLIPPSVTMRALVTEVIHRQQ